MKSASGDLLSRIWKAQCERIRRENKAKSKRKRSQDKEKFKTKLKQLVKEFREDMDCNNDRFIKQIKHQTKNCPPQGGKLSRIDFIFGFKLICI
jgi:hypothetical protein